MSIVSSDTRAGKGNRTVPYQFNCAKYNDPNLCSYQHIWPARANLGQLSFVLPGRGRSPPAPAAGPPRPGCSGMGAWCSLSAAMHKDHTTGAYTCKELITVSANASAAAASACNETASCGWGGGWKDKPFCPEAGGQIKMYRLNPALHHGYFDGSCDRIKWNNTFDRSSWCRAGTAACHPTTPPSSAGGGQPAGDFRFVELGEISKARQTLDMYTGTLSSNWSHTEHPSKTTSDVRVTTAVDSDTDTVSARFAAPESMGLAVQLAFCTVTRNGQACECPGRPTDMALRSRSKKPQ